MKRMLLAALVVLGLLATATIGQAASLPIVSRSNLTFSAQQPCPGTAAAVPSGASGATFSSVTATLPSGLCTGETVLLTVLNGSTVVAQGQAPVVGSTATVPTGTYTAGSPYTVRATVGGWNLPTTWSYVPPVAVQPFTADNAVTVVQSVMWSVSGGRNCAEIAVTTNTSSTSAWRINLNIAASPFNGATTGYVVTSGQVRFDPSVTPQNGVIGIVGTVNGWDVLRSNQSRSFTVCR